MNIEETMKRIDLLLQDRGLNSGYQEQAVRQLLYHLFAAIEIYKYMTVAERNKSGWWYRTFFKHVFPLTGFLKERKRKRDKENSPLHPSYKKESGVKEKDEKTIYIAGREQASFEERKKQFWAELEHYVGKYERQSVLKFYYYWAEEMRGHKKMRWEIQKSWNTSYRLAAWSKRSYQIDDKAAELRLERAKNRGNKSAFAPNEDQPKKVGVLRTREMEQQEAQIAERKAGAVTREDYLRMKAEGKI